MDEVKKPPLGLRPQCFAAEDRMIEIIRAIKRYEEAKVYIPTEWIQELGEVCFLICRKREEKK